MPSTLTVTSCSRKCKGCNYSNCKGRRSRKIGKCEYFCKYIFCCGWCFGTQSRERRPAKITRRVEHVDYIKIHSGTSKHKQKFNGSNKNETADLYFCTVSNYVTTWPNNQRQWAYKRPLATADDFKDFEAASIAAQKVRTCESNDVTTKSHFFISNPINLNIPFHNTRTFGQTYIAPLKKTPMFKTKTTKNLANIFSSCLRSKQRKGATRGNIRSKKIVHPISAHMSLKPDIINILDNSRSISGTTNDFSCQFSVNSMQSLEIISHVLTRSVSRLSSLDSILSLKWRRRFRRHDKQPSTLQVMMCTLVKKIRYKKSKHIVRQKKHNVVVLHVPKQFSNTSTLDTLSIARNSMKSVARIEKPLIIKDMSNEDVTIRSVSKPLSKICGPGEVLVKRD
ncbi:hypothetical protein O3G_MSEX015175 [Manduca sexta]|uniref:Uncharacterized protein n=1 Tax=Manduca sexta TaxID=7130 RepID=A0A921ZXF8_MANSE|nr:hypothetical protein O3G_MSEX015175 [Manduca sexta]